MIDDYQTIGYMQNYGERRSFYERYPKTVDPRGFRKVLTNIVGDGSILDYGCGHGSLGYIGHNKNNVVDGLDIAVSNGLAKYHGIEEVKEKYDTIIFSHVLEHFGTDGQSARRELSYIMQKAKKISNRIVVALPNNVNVFMRLRYQDDWTHNPVTIDNNDFLFFMESLGWKLVSITRCDMQLNHDPRNWFRMIFNYAVRMDPTYNIIYVFEVAP